MRISIFALCLTFLTGCATKALPAAGVGFVEPELMKKPSDLPFHKSWMNPTFRADRYTEIKITPVNIDYLPQMDWWKSLERGQSFHEDAKKLADYTYKIFRETFEQDPARRFQVVDQPGPKTLIFEIALVEIVPSKIMLNTIGYAPFVGTAAKLIRNTKSKSSVAFEARFRDGTTGEILAMFADREFEKMSPLNIKDVTWYGHAESIIHEWAAQFVRMMNRKEGEAVADSKPFHLKPW
jgi:hypothetical protein